MKLRYGYLISAVVIGSILLFSSVWSLPDGRLHIFFCDVGQGDSAYIRFPDGRDMVIDGGPGDAVLRCLSRHMPFWDRHINIIAMTHPEKDHMQGLIPVFMRYSGDYFIRSDRDAGTKEYANLLKAVNKSGIQVKFVEQGDLITLGQASLSILWPSSRQIAKGYAQSARVRFSEADGQQVLGATDRDLNDYSLVFALRYGSFDAIFTGDADARVEDGFTGLNLADEYVELLKVPHHGSKTGMTSSFVEWVMPVASVISVGKNSYGHPSREALELLKSAGSAIYRTDISGDIEVTSDGLRWSVNTERK